MVILCPQQIGHRASWLNGHHLVMIYKLPHDFCHDPGIAKKQENYLTERITPQEELS
jgi:hypothetical protein